MGMWIGRNRKARVTYGFDEIALVPGRVTINPNEVDITWRLARRESGAAGIQNPDPRQRDGRRGRRAVSPSRWGNSAASPCSISKACRRRYKNPQEVLQKIVEADKNEVTALLQKIYTGAGAGRSDCARGSRRSRTRACRPRSARSRSARSGSARSRRKRARIFSSCKAPSRPCATFPRNINRSSSRNSAARCASRSSSATPSASMRPTKSWNADRPPSSSASARARPAPRAACSAWACRRSPRRSIAPRRVTLISKKPPATFRSSPMAA